MTRPRPEPQIERKTESCHDKARALQNAERARQVVQCKLIDESKK